MPCVRVIVATAYRLGRRMGMGDNFRHCRRQSFCASRRRSQRRLIQNHRAHVTLAPTVSQAPCPRPPPPLVRLRRPCRRRSFRRRTKRRQCRCQRYRRRSTSMVWRRSTSGASRRTTRETTKVRRGARPRATRTASTRSPSSRRNARCVGRWRESEEEGWIA